MGIVLRRLRLEYRFAIQTCRVGIFKIFSGGCEMSEIGLVKIYSGKVRDLYEIDDKRMLMVASDRLSAF
ncbi:TPA: phosphoribosylaminoimidazolesuccinocarboxamide synthase, partial [Neisseria gonorrhoeae]